MTVALTALPSVCSSADPRSCRCRCRPPNKDSQDACRSGDYGAADSAVVVAAATAADGEEDDDDAAFVAVVVVAAAVGGGDDAAGDDDGGGARSAGGVGGAGFRGLRRHCQRHGNGPAPSQ